MASLQLFELSVQHFADPAFVSKRGTRVQGLFRLKPNSTSAQHAMSLMDAAIVYVLDTSGSMGGAGIEALKKAGEASLNASPDGNRVGMITFSSPGTAKWLFKPETLTDQSRQKMLRALSGLSSGGMTCFYEPLLMAVEALEKENVVIKQIDFLTDGQSNEGGGFLNGRHVPDTVMTLDLIDTRMVEKDPTTGALKAKIALNAYGCGPDYDQLFMADLVAAANGQLYHVLANGTGLDHLMGVNATRTAQAVAGSVEVEIKTQNGFTFFSFTDQMSGQTQYELFRTAPNKQRLTPLSDTLLVDPIGTVNAIEGVPYEFTLSGPAIQPPVGETVWSLVVATMTIRYKLADGEHIEVIDFEQSFTTDDTLVRQDPSVAQTMRQTALEVQAAKLAADYSVAMTMNDTAAQKSASMAMTMLQEQATRSRLSDLSADLGEMVDGMEAGDKDGLLAKRTRMMGSADFGDLIDGMEG